MRMVVRNDVRNVVRDRTIAALAVVPLVFVVLLRVGYRLLADVPAAADHRAIALSAFCVIAATFPAFMLSTIMLDEKDQGLSAVLRVLPVSISRIVILRAAVVAALGFVNAAVVLFGSGLREGPVATGLLLSALCALAAPGALLVAVALAGNQIEGITLFKGIFFLVFAAAAAQAAPTDWRHVLAVVPAYWTTRAFETTDGLTLAWTAVVAVVAHAAVVVVALRRLRRSAL